MRETSEEKLLLEMRILERQQVVMDVKLGHDPFQQERVHKRQSHALLLASA